MANYSSYYHKDYSAGLNDSSSAGEIDRNQASHIRNWDVRYKGQLRSREGLVQVGDTIASVSDGSLGFIDKAGSKELLVVLGTTLRYLNSTTWDALDTGFTAEPMAIENCPTEGKVYICSKQNQIHSWDKASYVANSCLTDLGSGVPHGNALKWWKNHMFTINDVVVSGTTYTNRCYVSNFGNADTWTTGTDFIELPGVGGKSVTFGEVGDSMILFKEHSMSFLTGYGLASWTLSSTVNNIENPDENVGTYAVRGGCKVGDEWWFLDDQGFIRRIYQTDFDAFRKDRVSDHVPTLLGDINPSYLSKAVMYSYGDKVYCAIPTGASTSNNVVLVYDLQASRRLQGESWTVIEGTGWKPSSMLAYAAGTEVNLYLADATAGKVYRVGGTSDLGDPIAYRWDSKDDDYEKPDRWKKYAKGYIKAPNQGDIDVTIHASVDGTPWAQLSTFNLQGSGSTLGPTGSFLLGPTGNNRLGGSEILENTYYFSDGGGTITGKSLRMSLRCSTTSPVVVNTFQNSYVSRESK